MSEKPILLIGPLPPPYGGATVSFQLFFDYIVKSCKTVLRHFNLPVYKNIKSGKANHIKTVWGILHALVFVPFSSSVIIFGSRNFAFFYSLLFLPICKCLGKKCCIRFFGGRPMMALSKSNAMLRVAVLSVFRLAHKIVVQTEIGAKEFPKYLHDKIEVLPGYRLRIPEKHLNQFHDDNNTIRFVYTGDVIKEKGITILLNAFSELKNTYTTKKSFELHLYGNGSHDIIDLVQRTDDVYYHGHVDNSSLRNSLPSYDIFIFPSLFVTEGHSGSIIEALMAGLPIIATDLPGNIEILRHNQDALIVKSGDVHSLTMAMERLVTDSELRRSIAAAALNNCVRFDARYVIPKLAKTLGIDCRD